MTVRLWDVKRAVLLKTLFEHIGGVTSVEFNPMATALASGGLDGLVLVWKKFP